MLASRLLSDYELGQYEKRSDLNAKAQALVAHQRENWPLASTNYANLRQIAVRQLEISGASYLLQFNPKRIRSTNADLDRDAIAKRRCFLCLDNLPPEQKGLLYRDRYLLLCNPFPIFHRHLTIAALDHRPQQIKNRFADLLDLSKELGEWVVFYNGPECGASAPDHFHFQAGAIGILPLERQLANCIPRPRAKGLNLYYPDQLRKVIVMQAADRNALIAIFNAIYDYLGRLQNRGEPRLNILCWWLGENGAWPYSPGALIALGNFLRRKESCSARRPWI